MPDGCARWTLGVCEDVSGAGIYYQVATERPLPPQPSQPSVVSYTATIAGEVSDFGDAAQLRYKQGLASTLSFVSADDITLTVASASILVTAEIRVSSAAAATAMTTQLGAVTATQLSQLTGTTVTAVSAPTVSAANPGDAASDEDGSIVMIAAAAGGVVFIIIVVGGIFALRGKKAPEPLPPKSVQQQVVAQSQVALESQALEMAMANPGQVRVGVPAAPPLGYPAKPVAQAVQMAPPQAVSAAPPGFVPRKFDPETGEPLPKFDPETGMQNW